MIQDRVSKYRVWSILSIIMMTALSSVILCVLKSVSIDIIFCVGFIDILFLCVLVFLMEYERKKGALGKNTETNFARVAISYFICSIAIVVFSFLPGFAKPFMLIPFLIYALTNESITYFISFYQMFLFVFIVQENLYEMVCYGIMIVFATTIVRALEEKSYRLYVSILSFLINMSIVTIFSYLEFGRLQIRIIGIALIESFVIALFILVAYYYFREETEHEIENFMMEMVQDDYPLVKELKSFSLKEYSHSQKVSLLCYRCANYLGYNGDMCAAAGFYYRIGVWEGEPYVENGVKIAQNYCFPVPIVGIIAEYNGLNKKPSTPESALVHVVDSLVTRLEKMENEHKDSQWNKDLLIYQTLNDFSTTGMYDDSGMSMNQFLKLREFLVKEEILN